MTELSQLSDTTSESIELSAEERIRRILQAPLDRIHTV